MPHANDIHGATNGFIPLRSVSNCLHGAAGRWLALQFEFDGRDIDVLHEIVEALDWRNVTFGCSIEATIQCRDIGALVMLRLADPGRRGLRWHPADFTASCQPCLDPYGLVAFVEYFTPDAAIDLVGDARIEFADADVLGQFLVACDDAAIDSRLGKAGSTPLQSPSTDRPVCLSQRDDKISRSQ